MNLSLKLLITGRVLAVLTTILMATPGLAGNINIPGDYETIQEGIDAANPGDIVVVEDGIWEGAGNRNLDFGGKSITVISANGPMNCIIDCGNVARGFYFHFGETSQAVVSGFTIRNGQDADRGGGILIENCSPTIFGCILTNNSADFGGGISVVRGSPLITSCTFDTNTADYGGGISTLADSGATFSDCTFVNNSASVNGGAIICSSTDNARVVGCNIVDNRAGANGGGIRLIDSNATIIDTTFTNNSAAGGGGMQCLRSDAIVTGCTFSRNTATSGGGGLANDQSSPIVTDCTFETNDASFAGGVYNNGGSPEYHDSVVKGNTGTSFGGGGVDDGAATGWHNITFDSNVSGQGGGGCASSSGSSPEFEHCLFRNNQSRDGGGLFLLNVNTPVTHSEFYNNRATRSGGAAYLSSSNAPLIGVVMNQNTANSAGGGLYLSQSSPPIRISTISNNTATNGGGINSVGSFPNVTNSNVWFNSPNQINNAGGSVTNATYSNVQGGWSGAGNINANPMFLDPANNDLRLFPGSPSIDAGRNAAVPAGINIDLDGNPRFFDDPLTVDTGLGTPPIVDMGPFEFQGGMPAMLTDVTRTLGIYQSGGVPEMQMSDDMYYVLQSGPGFNPAEPHPARADFGFDTHGFPASTIDITLEEKANIGGPTAVVLIRDWNTGQFTELDRFAVSPVDQTFTISDLPAGKFINGANRVEVRSRTFAILVLNPTVRGIFSHDFVGLQLNQ